METKKETVDCPLCSTKMEALNIWMKETISWHAGDPLITEPMKEMIQNLKRRYRCPSCEYKIFIAEDPEFGLVCEE